MSRKTMRLLHLRQNDNGSWSCADPNMLTGRLMGCTPRMRETRYALMAVHRQQIPMPRCPVRMARGDHEGAVLCVVAPFCAAGKCAPIDGSVQPRSRVLPVCTAHRTKWAHDTPFSVLAGYTGTLAAMYSATMASSFSTSLTAAKMRSSATATVLSSMVHGAAAPDGNRAW